jgi:hypothetical protein
MLQGWQMKLYDNFQLSYRGNLHEHLWNVVLEFERDKLEEQIIS